MTNSYFVSFGLSLVLATLAACSGTEFVGGFDGGLPVSDSRTSVVPGRPVCPGQELTLTGTVYAPNGKDPVPGARVFIPDRVPELFAPEVKCEVCGTFGSSLTLWGETTGYDGKFAIADVCPGTRVLVLQNGRFRRVVKLEIESGKKTVALSADQTRMPRKAGEFTSGDSVPKIAVATGDYDKMECVLRKMGLDNSAFDLFEGANFLKSPRTLPSFKDLIADYEKLKTYNIVFINCTENTFEAQLAKPEVQDNLRRYVRAGGRLYVTDWSYDWLEQLDIFAPFIDFERGPSNALPEAINAATIGEEGITVDATIKDEKLANWLGLFPGAIANGRTTIEHFAIGWVMIHDVHKDVQVWVEGKVTDQDGKIDDVRPLTVTFNFENCGKALFSSYHTEGRDEEFSNFIPRPKAFPDYCGSNSSPQDRILEYLIFDIASCIKPVG